MLQEYLIGCKWIKFYYGQSPWTWDWDGTITANSSAASDVVVFQTDTVSRGDGESIGILRNSINRQSTIGLISKMNYDLSEAIKLQFGLDWRTAGIEHAREVRDLLGGDYYMDYADDNAPDGKRVELGDKIAYSNVTTVDWLGFFGQGSYSSGPTMHMGCLVFLKSYILIKTLLQLIWLLLIMETHYSYPIQGWGNV